MASVDLRERKGKCRELNNVKHALFTRFFIFANIHVFRQTRYQELISGTFVEKENWVQMPSRELIIWQMLKKASVHELLQT